jgi:hypothetical protein
MGKRRVIPCVTEEGKMGAEVALWTGKSIIRWSFVLGGKIQLSFIERTGKTGLEIFSPVWCQPLLFQSFYKDSGK